MISNTKKGYFTLEAAILLPIFIIGILTLGYFIKVYSTAENITFSILDEIGHLASEAYGKSSAGSFPGEVTNRLQQENKSLERVETTGFRYLYSDDRSKDGLISLGCKYRIAPTLPVKLTDGIELDSQIKCRGFIGKENSAAPMPFSEMEKNGDSEIVWIFPMSGEKFHKETCRFVKANPVQQVLTPKLKSEYTPCRLCKPQDVSPGTYVYCFLRTGTAYHQGTCHMIEKYTIEIEKEDAQKKGYQPCSICGGG